jgi:NNP family nitrate/nitrite transporter-like MFS transporter
MPLLMGAVIMLGVSETMGWRVALLVPGVLMLVMAVVYWKLHAGLPGRELQRAARGRHRHRRRRKGGWASFKLACRNYRVWLLFVTYGACFGIEIFIHNIAAVYYVDHFKLSLGQAGMAAGSFGLLALFARALGGWLSDKAPHAAT